MPDRYPKSSGRRQPPLSPDDAQVRLARAIRRHSLGWLVAANVVGVLLAALLLWPAGNELLGPLTYGRWAPVHQNWQLYGWCAVPLLGALLHYYLPATRPGVVAGRAALGLWSVALLAGGASWLAGWNSGKIFLEWTGAARLAWSAALFGAWLILVASVWPRRREFPWWALALLAAMGAVPLVLYGSASPSVYPSVDPDTGGATGRSLLGSTLGILSVFGLLPWLLRIPRRAPPAGGGFRWRKRFYAALLGLSFLYDAALRSGHISHHDIGHEAGLVGLAAWIPLAWLYGRSFVWPSAARPWLIAAFAWWLFLVADGAVTFLPAVADRLKFTNGLVAHTHLAMAGMVSALNLAVLMALPRGKRTGFGSFWIWQVATAVHVAVLLWLGWREGADPSLLYVRNGVADGVYAVRLAAGLCMAGASWAWLVGAWRGDRC